MGCREANERLHTNIRALHKGEAIHPMHGHEHMECGLAPARGMVKRFYGKEVK